MPLSTTFQLYRGGQFNLLVEETGVPEKTTNVVSSTSRLSRARTHNISGDMH
jgi:hypothetical protein